MLKSSIVAFTMRIGGMTLWLGFTVLLARGLDVEQFGTVFLVVNASLVGALFVLAGYNVVVLGHASAFWHQGRQPEFVGLLRESRFVLAGSSVVLGVGLGLYHLVAPTSALTLDAGRIGFVVALSALTGLMTLHMDALRSCDQMVKALFGTTTVRTFGSILLVAPFVLTGTLSVERALTILTIVLCLAVLLEIYWLHQLGGRSTQWNLRLPHFRQAIAILPGELAMVLLRRSTSLILGLHGDLSAVAMFVAAERVALLSDFLTDAVRLAIGPRISVAAQGTRDELREVCQRASALMFVVGIGGALGTALIAWPVLAMFGDAYTEAFFYVIALVCAQLSWAILGPVAIVANMTGLSGLRSRISSIATLVMVVSQFLLLPVFGAGAVVGALVITTWGLNIALWMAVRSRCDILVGVLGTSPTKILAALRSEIAVISGKAR